MKRSGPPKRRKALRAKVTDALLGPVRPLRHEVPRSTPPDRTASSKPVPVVEDRRAQPTRADKAAWHDHPRTGRCRSCGKRDQILTAHHVVLAQMVRAIQPEREFDIANRWLIGWFCCHGGHHGPGVKDTRLDFSHVPRRCRRFADEVLGPGPAANYFARRYRNAPRGG